MGSHLSMILIFSSEEDKSERIKEVNSYIRNKPLNLNLGLVSINCEKLPKHWYGGDANFLGEMFIGAYRGLDLESIFNHISSNVNWKYPESVILLISEADKNDATYNVYTHATRKLVCESVKL